MRKISIRSDLTTRSLGQRGFCLWTARQKKILDNDKRAFSNNEKIRFSEALGFQYHSMIMVLDSATTIAMPDEITIFMSWATTSLYVIVNDRTHACLSKANLQPNHYRPSKPCHGGLHEKIITRLLFSPHYVIHSMCEERKEMHGVNVMYVCDISWYVLVCCHI